MAHFKVVVLGGDTRDPLEHERAEMADLDVEFIQVAPKSEGEAMEAVKEADAILRDKGVFVVPDILANAGGVVVSYFEWVQDLQSFFWEEDEINQRLRRIMEPAF